MNRLKNLIEEDLLKCGCQWQKKCNLRGHRLTGPRGPNKKSNVNNEDELEAQIMDELVPLET